MSRANTRVILGYETELQGRFYIYDPSRFEKEDSPLRKRLLIVALLCMLSLPFSIFAGRTLGVATATPAITLRVSARTVIVHNPSERLRPRGTPRARSRKKACLAQVPLCWPR
jgi:hypothetical protein